jgi:hypothetical protein
MKRITRWLERNEPRIKRRLSVEEALLGGRFLRYTGYRLTGFALSRLLGAVTHVLEFTFLAAVFSLKGVIASLALQNTALIAGAFWWGCLEVLRARIRLEKSKNTIVARINLWLAWSARLGILAILVPLAVSLVDSRVRGRPLGVIDGYALVCGLRLALDLVSRTYYSGVYALRRVYRPIFSVLLAEPLGLVLILVFWRHLKYWSFPVGLAVTLLISRGLQIYYASRAYELLRLPRPRLRLRARRPRSIAGTTNIGDVIRGGLANLSTRIGSLLALTAMLTIMLGTDAPVEMVLALHLSATLLGAAAYWTQTFYPDFKKLERDAYGLLRARLERSLGAMAVVVGSILWAASAAVVYLFLGQFPVGTFIAALYPVFVSASYLSTLQLRDFARGMFSRLLISSGVMCGALVGILFIGGGGEVKVWSLLMTGALMSGVVVLWTARLWLPPQPASGVMPSLLAWVRAASSVKGPVRIARTTTRKASVTQCNAFALRIAEALGGRGASVVVPSARRVIWFEHEHAALRRSQLVTAGGGKIWSLDRTTFCDSGEQALATAVKQGLISKTEPAKAGPIESGKIEAAVAALIAAFRERFRDRGFVADLLATHADPALAGLLPAQRQAIWRDATHEVLLGRISGQISGFEVTSFRPAGEIRMLFAVPKTVSLDERLDWRGVVASANWKASISAGGDGAISP